uniref:Uncharacterized protein n=1 Tax=Paramormyrops kingsleyae TaxID=1676925 RepID=A0A3B3RI62_9TELE
MRKSLDGKVYVITVLNEDLVYLANQGFWYFSRKVFTETFYFKLRQNSHKGSQRDSIFESLQRETERVNGTWDRLLTPGEEVELKEDSDSELSSGTGDVSKDCLESLGVGSSADGMAMPMHPKGLSTLIWTGIPEALHAKVWQLLSGCQNDPTLLDRYRVLIINDSLQEGVITHDKPQNNKTTKTQQNPKYCCSEKAHL